MKYILILLLALSPITVSANQPAHGEEENNEIKPDQKEAMDESQRKMDQQLGKKGIGPAPTNKKAKKPFSSKEEKAKDDKKSAYP
ncbi:hypothetical protein B9G69_002960 [Bdellovibrio sp. SKB1291214]|uniref:hypothetical protein n=1 Tax=Bdellovibrio sp. SKB1291214 TaxID=1732569 RepID=UPI000B5156A4|nr:hypothetical protein [Bdellovibrio sp. SKB1291214]UYL09531.1 hypothetical protein B9G69_002960 [Bdellovibrio sp. SKB1291214]